MIYDAQPTDMKSVVLANVGVPLADPRYEIFAQRVAAGSSYKAAYEVAFPNAELSAASSARHNASRLAAHVDVQARVRGLTRAAAEGAMPAIRERIAALLDIASADPGELCRVVIESCGDCWPAGPDGDEALAAAIDAAVAANGSMPDPSEPRPSCTRCGGRGVRRVVLTPTDELSGSGRRLYKGARQKSDGSIEVQMHDALAATRLLAELSGWLVNQNLNLNANAAVQPTTPASVQDVLDAYKSMRSAP
jgi:hypothetical protein